MFATTSGRLRTVLFLIWTQCAVVSALGEIRDGGIDPSNLGKGEWLYYMSSATNQLGGYVSSVTNENSLMLYLKSQGTRYVIVKAATSDQLFYGSYSFPQFTSNLVSAAHTNGLLIFGYNRSYGQNIQKEIEIADYVFGEGADGFVWDAEAEWESNQSWITTNGPTLAWQLCSAVRSNWPTKFLAHSPFAIVGLHASFPYKEFGYWSDAVMPQIYHFAKTKLASAAINWTDVNWTYYQDLWSNLPPANLNGHVADWSKAIKPLAPIQDVYGPPYSASTPDKDVEEFIDYLAADPNTPAVGGYGGANFFRADLHDEQQWEYIRGGTPGAVAGVVNNLVLDNPNASVVGTAMSVRTYYVINNTLPDCEVYGSDWGTNSFGTNYLTLAQGSGGNYVEFAPNIVVPGDYMVYQWHPYRADASAGVPFEIVYNGGSTIVYANQQTNDGNWSVLGTFNFAAGSAGKIRVKDAFAEAGGVAVADGIKLVFVSPATLPPAAPSDLTASAVSSSRIDLGWSTHATNAVHNVVSRATAAAGPYMEVGVVPWSSTGFSDTELAGDTTYYYKVRAVNAAGSSGYAGPASATTLPAPPKILLHPLSQLVAAGSSVTFTVVAAGAAPLSYQWRFDGTNIAGATESAYTLASVQVGDTGSYSVVVSNGVGSATSWDAVLTVVEGLFTLTVTTDENGSAVKSPDQANYPAGTVVAVTATPSAGYAFAGWTGDITSAGNPLSVTMWSNMTIMATFAPSLTDIILDNTNEAVMFSGTWATGNSAAGRYGPDYCYASTAAGGTSTATYMPTIAVSGYYTIYVMYPAGSNRATNAPYVIQTDDAYFQTAINQQVNGGTWRPLMYMAHLSPGNLVYVQLSNDTGYSGKVVIADAVRFELYQADTLEPFISSQPVSQQAGVGDTVSFSVTASGAVPLSYFWQRNGVPIAGATDSTYTISNVQLSDSGSQFSCLVSNDYGTALSSTAVLTVVAYPPQIIWQPANQMVAVGGTAAFSVTASGTPPLLYHWRRNGALIAGATGSMYTTNNVQLADSGSQFSCLVSNAYGVVFSSNAVLTVVTNVGFVFAVDFESGLQGFTIDNTVGSGNGLWHLSTGRGSDAGHSPTHSLYYGHNEGPTGGGNYDTGAANGGAVISPAISLPAAGGEIWLSFNYLMAVESGTSWDVGYVEVTTNNGASYSAVAVKDSFGGLNSWTGEPWVSNGVNLNAFAGSSIRLRFRFDTSDSVANSTEGWYVDDIVIALVGNAPSITSQPQDVSAVVGNSATFSVSASGTAPLNYFWRRDGLPITGATGSSYTTNNVQLADSGSQFSCLVSNAYGTALSSNAVLMVNAQPDCAAPPVGLASWWRAEGDGGDSVGGNHGALKGGASFAPGRVGQAFSLSGSNQCVRIPYSPSLSASNYSVEAWVNPVTQVSDSISQDLIFGQSVGEVQLVARTGTTGVRIAFLFGVNPYTFYEVLSATEIPIGQFSHLVGTWDGTALRLYINGVLSAQSTPGAVPVDSGCDFFIGGFNDTTPGSCAGAGQFFHGLIDEASFYRRALSAAEVQTLYSAGGAGKCFSPIAPTIVAQPTNQDVTAGSSVNFSVVATGTPPLDYQWRFNGTNLSGATASSLELTDVQLADAGSYSVLVSNSAGAILSTDAVLTVLAPPPCLAPAPGVIAWYRAENNALDLIALNNGTSVGGVSYVQGEVGQAFSFNGTDAEVRLGSSLGNFGTNDFTIEFWIRTTSARGTESVLGKRPNCNANSTGFWDMRIFNGVLGFEMMSPGVVNLNVISATHPVNDGTFHHVAFVRQGTTGTLYIDGAFEASASTPGISYLNTSGVCVIGRSACVGVDGTQYFTGQLDEITVYEQALSLPQVQSIFAAGGGGKCTGAVPVIVSPPASLTIDAGATATFSVWAEGTPPLSYQWLFETNPIAGATGSSLVLEGVQPQQAGNYSVIVTNPYGSATASNVVLTVLTSPPVITTQPADQTVSAGDTGLFAVTASGSLPLSYQWFFETNPVAGATGVSLVLSNAQPAHAGNYSVVVSNAYGTATSSNALLTVLTFPPTILSQPVNRTVAAGSNATFSVAATGTPPLSYQWFRETDPLPGATSYSLALTNVQPAQAGSYSVVVSNAYGTTTSSNALLTVLIYPPTITVQPQSRTVYQGGTTNFSVTATGTAPLSYQWYFNSNSLPGRTASTLSLTNIQPDQAGTYSVLVTNSYGSLMSSNAYLTILPPPVCVSPPAGIVAWWRAESNTVDSIGISDAAFQYLNSGYTNGKVGAAFRLAQGGFLRVPASSDLDLGPGAGLTIEGWIRPDTISTVQAVAEWNNGSGYVGAGLMLNYFTGSGVLEGYLTDTNAKPTRAIVLRSPAYAVTNLVWQHVALTFDKSDGVAAIYVNGTPVAQTNLGTFLPATAKAPFYLGYRASGSYSGARFFGGMDEMALYNRALSAAEIQSIILADSQGKCPPPPPPCVPPLSGIVAWWRGQSNTLDSVDNNNGFITNSVTYTNGKVATCFQFVNGYVRVPAASNLNVGVGPGLTIELWTKPTFWTPQPFVEWNSGTGAQGPTLCVPTTAPIFEANLVDTLGVSHLVQSPLGLFTNNVWQHLAVTYDKASGIASMFFNGTVVTQRNVGTFTPRTASDVYLGYRPPGSYSGSGLKFTGSMDEVSLYGRALTSDEIRGIYVTREVGKCATPAPPFIISQPVSKTVTLGGTATFTLQPPAGTPPFGYQWCHSGTHLAAATGSSLVLPGVTLAHAGDYSVVVTNVSGSITSAVATLTVNQPPTARNLTAATKQNLPLSIPAEKLLLFAWDPEGDPLTVVGVSTSTNGAAVALGGGAVTYTPVTGFIGTDRFAYTVGDAWGGTGSAFVQVEVRPADQVSGNMLPPAITDVGFLVRFAAIPGRSYTLQRAESLSGPWLTLTTIPVGASGLGVYEDTNPPPGGAYYRTIYP